MRMERCISPLPATLKASVESVSVTLRETSFSVSLMRRSLRLREMCIRDSSSSLFDYKTSVDGLQLDVHGRYTTGDAELDAMLTVAAKDALKSGMTQEQRLRAMYDYAKKTFSYRGAQSVETGSTGWEQDIAKTMLTSKKGNCYSWAAAFT